LPRKRNPVNAFQYGKIALAAAGAILNTPAEMTKMGSAALKTFPSGHLDLDRLFMIMTKLAAHNVEHVVSPRRDHLCSLSK
jgi:urease accessory protein UreF